VSAEIAQAHAESEFEKYRIVQDRLFESDFDRFLKQIESGNTLDGDKEEGDGRQENPQIHARLERCQNQAGRF
jgi:hypothetical protein